MAHGVPSDVANDISSLHTTPPLSGLSHTLYWYAMGSCFQQLTTVHMPSKVSFQNKIMIAFNMILSGSIIPPLVKVFLVWFSMLARLTILSHRSVHAYSSKLSFIFTAKFVSGASCPRHLVFAAQRSSCWAVHRLERWPILRSTIRQLLNTLTDIILKFCRYTC